MGDAEPRGEQLCLGSLASAGSADQQKSHLVESLRIVAPIAFGVCCCLTFTVGPRVVNARAAARVPAAIFADGKLAALLGCLGGNSSRTGSTRQFALSPQRYFELNASDRLDRANLLGLRALGALAGGELDPLVLCKTAETVSLDGGVVNEDVGGAVVGGDETVALVSVEPLHSALSHVAFSCCTTFGVHGCVSRDAAAACLLRAGIWIPEAPAVRISR